VYACACPGMKLCLLGCAHLLCACVYVHAHVLLCCMVSVCVSVYARVVLLCVCMCVYACVYCFCIQASDVGQQSPSAPSLTSRVGQDRIWDFCMHKYMAFKPLTFTI
jgi:hypothetical protein